MPVAIPIIAAVAGAAATAELGTVIGATLLGSTLLATGAAALGGFVVSTAINAVGTSLTPKPKSSSLTQDPNSVQDTVRSNVESHKIIYGQTRVSGVVVFDGATSTGTDNLGAVASGKDIFRHFVIAIAGHEVAEIGTIYLENTAVTLDANGFVQEAPYIRAGSVAEFQVSALPLSAVNSADGILFTTSTAHTFTAGETVYIPFATSSKVTATAYSGYTVSSTPSPTTFTIAAGPDPSTVVLDGKSTVYVKRTSSNDTRFIRVKKFLGAADQAASTDLINEISAWTTNHRLRGITYIYIRIQQAAEFNMNISNVSAIVKGKKVYDPRTSTTGWSANAALCVRDYLTSDYGAACDAEEINDTVCIAAANLCDESVTLQTGSQPRYTCNGVLDTATALFDNLQALLSASAGTVTYVQGQFRINPAAYDAPTGTITEDMLAGPVNSQARPSRQDLFNAVSGTFIDATQAYAVTDFPMVTNATYEAQDGGEQIPKDIQLPFTTDVQAAQRIAKLINEVARQGITVTVPLNHSALTFAVNDTVYMSNARRGWSNKIFRIKQFSLAYPGPFTATLSEEAAAAYDWNNGEATVKDPAPDSNLPNPLIVAAPGVPMITESLYETRGSTGVKALATVSWAESGGPYASYYVAEYQRVEDIGYTVLPQTNALTIDIEDIQPGVYNFRVRCINALGVPSPYATLLGKEIFGLQARPADIVGLTLQGMWGSARLSWTQPTDLDVKIGGRILVRHSEATTGATWENSTTIGNDTIAGNANGVELPLKAGTYMVKAEDSSGLTSVNTASVTTKSVSLIAFSDIVTVTEDPGFTGTNGGTIEDSGFLRIVGGVLFDSIPDVDALLNFDFAAGVGTTGTYTFATPYTDLTTVQDIRLQSKVELATENVLDLFDSRQAFMDSWLDVDGANGGGAVDCWVEVSTSDDDPAATPVWTDYNRVDVADVNCRAFRCRAQLRSTDPAFNALVSTLRITAKQVTP